VDEQRLGQVFRDAVETMPPASFGHEEVLAASRRATARRRGMLAGGTLLSVAVLAGGLVAGGAALRNDTADNAVAAPGGQAESDALRTLDAPRCGPIDVELAADLTALLANRGSVASGPASEVPEPCPAGSQAAAVPVPGGVLYVLLVPQVEPKRVEAAAPDAATRDGARSYSVTLDGGRTLMVISMPGTPGQPAPLADEVPDLARELAHHP
jgi:hypothetical protein